MYVGVTSNIQQRIQQHRDGTFSGFTAEYGVATLVWYEPHTDMAVAFRREKSIKRWQRAWKIVLIEAGNPEWRDMWPTLFGSEVGPPLPREKLGPGSSAG